MKGITLCAECVYYSMKKHRCTRGAHIETDPKAPFYDDCPLPAMCLAGYDAIYVLTGRRSDNAAD